MMSVKNVTEKERDWKLSDKEIREKLVVRGVKALTDAELLSIVISLEKNLSSFDFALKLLESCDGNLNKLYKMDISQLRMVKGLGVNRAAVLSAALELGKRVALKETEGQKTIDSNEDVISMFRPMLANLPHEEFWILYLSSANTILDKAKVSQGGVSVVSVDHKLIVKRAVELLASSIILIHNHPSGIAQPSEEDILVTNKIITSASLFDINVLDHLIITSSTCFSFRGSNLL